MDPEVYARMAAYDDKHWWFVARRRILARVTARHVQPSAELRILEAGCGTGGNLPMLRKFGQVSAFEMDADARHLAKARSGGAVDEALPPPGVLNRLLKTVFGLERYLVDRWPLPFGVSLLLVARPR